MVPGKHGRIETKATPVTYCVLYHIRFQSASCGVSLKTAPNPAVISEPMRIAESTFQTSGALVLVQSALDVTLETLCSGTTIDLAGRVGRSTDRFCINLVAETGDIAIHINPLFDEGCVVFNSYRGGYWEHEERVVRMPVQRGSHFETRIRVDDAGYQVAFDNKDFTFFKHRMNCSLVKRLVVEGSVTIRRFDLQK
ncbi:galectin-7-like isoform X1 [Amblyomma americanum]